MGKARSVDVRLARLRALRSEPVSADLVKELRSFIEDKSNFVVAAAAEVIGEQKIAELAPELAAAFHRFLIDPVETDKLCKAKIAIVEALDKLECNDTDIFRLALNYVQKEPRWGGSDDTAAPLRAAAAYAMVRLGPRDLVFLLVDLLADPEKIARAAAAKALGASGLSSAVAVLRLKSLLGDQEPEVVVACLAGLLAADPTESMQFVVPFLDADNDEIAEGVALALGESRRSEALDAIRACWKKSRNEELRSVLLLAIAITRLPAGIDFLIDILSGKAEADALDAMAGLAVLRHNPAVRERVAEVVQNSTRVAIRDKFKKDFRID